ncbi:MAG: hypothetical protein ACSLFB_05215 [Acidimicrobiales bacterium]
MSIAGMIVGSIAGSTGWPVTFGIISAIAALCLIVATTVASSSLSTPPRKALGQSSQALDENLGEEMEQTIADLQSAGADEDALRSLVGQAFRLGRLIGGDDSR